MRDEAISGLIDNETGSTDPTKLYRDLVERDLVQRDQAKREKSTQERQNTQLQLAGDFGKEIRLREKAAPITTIAKNQMLARKQKQAAQA